MLTIDSFALDLETYLGDQQIQQVRKAYHFAEAAHEGQARRSGEAYITHPLAVAAILADMHMDHKQNQNYHHQLPPAHLPSLHLQLELTR